MAKPDNTRVEMSDEPHFACPVEGSSRFLKVKTAGELGRRAQMSIYPKCEGLAFEDLTNVINIEFHNYEISNPLALYGRTEIIDSRGVLECVSSEAEFMNTNPSFRSRLEYVLEESAYGSMDYVCFPNSSGVILDRTYFDSSDFRNFMWGCGVAKLNIPYIFALVGSHGNDFLKGCEQNGSSINQSEEEFCLDISLSRSRFLGITYEQCLEQQIYQRAKEENLTGCFKGLHLTLDSKWDQRAIRKGYRYCSDR